MARRAGAGTPWRGPVGPLGRRAHPWAGGKAPGGAGGCLPAGTRGGARRRFPPGTGGARGGRRRGGKTGRRVWAGTPGLWRARARGRAKRAGLRQAVSIGSGAMILETRQKSLVERAMCQLARTIEGREPLAEVISLNVKMPKFLFMSRSNNLWIQVGKKRGLTKGELKEGYYKAP